MKLPKILAGDHETNFSVKHMFKDVQLAIQAANRSDIDIPATTATAGALYNAISQGWADLDFSAVAKFYDLRKARTPPAPAQAAPAPAGARTAPAPVQAVDNPGLPPPGA